MELEKQKNIAKEVLGKLHNKVDKNAIIAGGACRNWMEGVLANDIDIFINNPLGVQTKNIILECLSIPEKYLKSLKLSYDFGEVINIVEIIEFKYDEVLFQIMCCDLEKPKTLATSVMQHIDTGINKLYYHPANIKYSSRIRLTPEYRKDIKENTITLYTELLTDNQILHSVRRHLPKMLKYYPNKFVRIENGAEKKGNPLDDY